MSDVEPRLAEELRRRAAMVPVSPPPLDAIEETARRPRVRLLVAASAAVLVVMAVLAVTVLPARQSPDPGPPPVTPATEEAPPDWTPRGSLGQDSTFLAEVDALLLDTQLGRERGGTGLDTAVWFAGDTPAGRVVVGVASLTDPAETRSEVLVLSGPAGTAPGELVPVGGAGEPADGPVSRLINRDGRWWLFALGAPEAEDAEVSWYPRYGPDGPAPRDWQRKPAAGGVLVTEAPGQAVAARFRLLRRDEVIADQPVIEDSDNLNDPSFFPVELGALTPVRPDTELRGADRDTVTWLANQIGVATGAPVPDMRITVLWTGADAAAQRLLAALHLPGNGTIAGYVTRLPGPDRTVDLVPVRGQVDRLTFVHVAREPSADGTPGRLEIVAAHAPHGTVRLLRFGGEVATASLDATGYGELDYAGPANDLTMAVSASGGGPAESVRLDSGDHTDPFDLRG